MAANKRAAASSRVVVPGAEPAEEPPMPSDTAAYAQHAQQAAEAPGRTPAFAAADTSADESDKVKQADVYCTCTCTPDFINPVCPCPTCCI